MLMSDRGRLSRKQAGSRWNTAASCVGALPVALSDWSSRCACMWVATRGFSRQNVAVHAHFVFWMDTGQLIGRHESGRRLCQVAIELWQEFLVALPVLLMPKSQLE